MKRWFWSVLVVLLLITSEAAYQVSGDDEELPGMKVENVQEL